MPATPAAGLPTLRLLGGAVIQAGETLLDGPVAQRHRLALLAILAVEARPVSRDKLVAYLWPERETEAARNLLKSAVHAVRKQLGERVLVSTGDVLSIDPSLLRCDVTDFEAAARGGELRTAMDLYAGSFLDGFFLKESSEFEDWASAERLRLERIHEKVREVIGDSAEIPTPVNVPVAGRPEPFDSAEGNLREGSGTRARWLILAAALIVVAVGTVMVLRNRAAAPFANPSPAIVATPNDVDPGTALYFDGVLPNASTPLGTVITTQTDDIAVDMWVKFAGPTTKNVQGLFYNGHPGLSGWGLVVVGHADGYPDGTIAALAGGITIRATPLVLKPDVWQHVSAERHEGKVTVTLDDSSYAIGNFPVTPIGGKYKAREKTSLGGDSDFETIGKTFHGAIDRFRIRNLAAAWWYDRWYFDEGQGTTATGYKGTVLHIGGAKWVPSAAIAPRDVFWSRLESLCEQAVSGTSASISGGDTTYAHAPLILYAYHCAPNEIRLALDVGPNRSRVIVLRRVGTGLSMTHELHLEGGALAPGSGASGMTRDSGTVSAQTFVGTGGAEWRMEIEPIKTLTYVARRAGADDLRIDFSLARQVPSPPPPWGGL